MNKLNCQEGDKSTRGDAAAVMASEMPTAELFAPLDVSAGEAERMARPSLNFRQDVWRRLKQNKAAILAMFVLLVMITLSIAAPLLSPYSPSKISSKTKDILPNAKYWFGTDLAGRDIWTRVWVAGRTSLLIGVLGALISTVVGVLYGAVAGFAGGLVDTVMMRIAEILSSLPYLLVVILLQIYLRNRSLATMLLALTITAWTGAARMVRAEILRLKGLEFVQAARVLGVGWWKIMTRHLIPNALPIVIVGITFEVPSYIFSEAFLSFLGIGLAPPETSWGIMCHEAVGNLMFFPHQTFFPSLMIALTMLCFTLFGDGLRDAFDPKMRS